MFITKKSYGHVADHKSNARFTIQRTVAFALALGLVGCVLGPDFKPPLAPEVTNYTATPIITRTNSAATSYVQLLNAQQQAQRPEDSLDLLK